MEKLINDWSSSSCCSDDHSRHLHVWSRCCGEDQEGHHGERHLSTEVGPGTEGTPGVIDPLSLNITASSVNSEKFLLINNKFVCSGESEEDDDSERTPRQTRETEWQHAGRLEESIRRLQVHRTWGGRAHSGFYSRTGGWFPATVRCVCADSYLWGSWRALWGSQSATETFSCELFHSAVCWSAAHLKTVSSDVITDSGDITALPLQFEW